MDKIVGRFKRCKNGHYYDKNLEECPYCPSTDSNTSGSFNDDRTKVDIGKRSSTGGAAANPNNDSTQIFGTTNDSGVISDNTVEFDDIPIQPSPKKQEQVDFSKTVIIDNDTTNSLETGKTNKQEEHIIRKLVGWLISYTIDDMGVDFKLYEGRNTVGKLPENNICIPNDNSISGHHLTILYRNNKFKIRDELSTNGTSVNGEEIETSQIFEINDGDIIKIGNTTFIFKTPILNNN